MRESRKNADEMVPKNQDSLDLVHSDLYGPIGTFSVGK